MAFNKNAVLAVLAPVLIYSGIYYGMHVLKSGWAAILLYHLAISVVLTAAGGWSVAGQLFRGWRTGTGTGSVVFSFLVGVVVYIAWSMVETAPGIIADTVGAIGLRGAALVLFALYYALVNPALMATAKP